MLFVLLTNQNLSSMNFFQRVLIFLVCISLLSCANPFSDRTKDSSAPYDGFVMYKSPTKEGGVGRIIAVNKKGVWTQLMRIEPDVTESKIQVSDYDFENRTSIAALGSFVDESFNSVDVSTSVNISKEVKYSVTMSNPVHKYLELVPAISAIESARNEINSVLEENVIDLSKQKIYLVTEAIEATGLNYSFEKKTVKDLSLTADAFSELNISGAVASTSGSSVTLSYDLQEPYFVYYKLNKLNISGDLGGAYNFELNKSAAKVDSFNLSASKR